MTDNEKLEALDNAIKVFDNITFADLRKPQFRERLERIFRIVDGALGILHSSRD